MADVRLTAVNPEDSQVYPVACNDKGELLLDSGGATGDLNVTGKLTVAGDTVGPRIFAGPPDTAGIGFQVYQPFNGDASVATILGDGSATFSGDVNVGNPSGDRIALIPNGTSHVSGNWFIGGAGSTSSNIELSAQGSATFESFITSKYPGQGQVQIAASAVHGVMVKDTDGNINATLNWDGSAIFAGKVGIGVTVPSGALHVDAASGVDGPIFDSGGTGNTNHALLVRDSANNQLLRVNNDGSATFASNAQGLVFTGVQDSANSAVFRGTYTGSPNAYNSVIYGDGSANFSGNVTAPNINFKLAPATVAAMPAPLIDEGFASNNEVDLLSVLMEMKLQIRDLNAFMQRSTQDNPET